MMLICVGLMMLFSRTRAFAAPNNDACWAAQELYITMTGSGSTAQATVDGDSTCGGSNAGPDVWYKFYAKTTGFLSITTQGSDYDTVISMHDDLLNGCPGDDSDTVACNDDCIAGTPGYSCINNAPIIEGRYYYIRVSGYNGATGNYSLSFGQATIKGKVIDTATSQPIQGVSVYAKSRMDPTSSHHANYAGYASTDASGNYSLIVPGGSYQVTAFKMNYLEEAYDGILCGDGCSRTTGPSINVANGQQVNSINFSLDLGGTISGTVTDKETGAPLAGVHVYMDGNEYSGGFFSDKLAITDANGNYAATRLPPGTYYPFIRSTDGYEPQLYNNIPCTQCAKRTDGEPVFVAAGTNTTGIDFALGKGSTISGTITDDVTGLPIEGATVKIRGISYDNTDAAGNYSITGVPPGDQVLVVGALGYAHELYNNVFCSWFTTCNTENGTMIAVPANSTLNGVNVALSPHGKISGKVTDAVTSQPISSLNNLGFYDSTGNLLAMFGNGTNGTFTLDSLAPGNYYLLAGALNYVTQVYNGLSCPGKKCNVLNGTPIQVLKGQTTSGIIIALQPAGSISGQVFAGATPLPNALITVYNEEGDPVVEGIEADDFGEYKINGLPTGAYFVKAEAGSSSVNKRYIPEIYNNVDCMACVPHADGTPVNVSAGAETTGINFTLAQGGAISGKIVGAIGGAPLSAKVSVFNAAGNFVSEAITDGSGQYITKTGLVTGNYLVYADGGSGHTAEMYNDILCPQGNCDLFSGDLVSAVTNSTTPNINFGLIDCADLSLSPGTIAPMTEGQSYNQQFSAAGGQAPFLYSIAGGDLPSGLVLSTNGALGGTPEAGDFGFVVRVVDANGCKRSVSYAVTVPEQPCLFCDDFEDASPAVDWTYAKGLWAEEGGKLISTPSGKVASAFAIPAFAGCTNCFMETSMQTSGGALNKMWFFAWYQNKNNTVEVLMKEESDKWVFRQRVNGVVVSKGKGVGTINPGQLYVVRVNYTGNSFELSVDGNVLATIPAVGQPFGSVGYQVKNTIGSFGHVMIN